MKKYFVFFAVLVVCQSLTGCGTMTGAAIGGAVGGGRGAVAGAMIGATVDVVSLQQQAYYANQAGGYYGNPPVYDITPVCRPWYGKIVCENVAVPSRTVYYSNPPFNPGYRWNYWYEDPRQVGFVFFFGHDGKHHRHQVQRSGHHSRQTVNPQRNTHQSYRNDYRSRDNNREVRVRERNPRERRVR